MPYNPSLTDDQQTCDTIEVDAHYRGPMNATATTPDDVTRALASAGPHDYAKPEAYRDDLPLSTCISAYSGISHSPERRGASEVQCWCEGMASDYRNLLAHATTPEQVEMLNRMWQDYRTKLRSKKLAQLRSLGQVVSTMIAGPANFPVRRMEKRNAAERKRSDEYLDYANHGKALMFKALHPELEPIRSGDADALERLQEKATALKAEQEHMKTANKILRAHKKSPPDVVVAALVAAGMSEVVAQKVIEPGVLGNQGYARFELTNNLANIKRVEQRIAEVQRLRTKQVEVAQVSEESLPGPTGIRVELAPAENRVRIHFPGKPDADTISKLKSGGFRWAPSQSAWSAYFKPWNVAKARQFAGLS